MYSTCLFCNRALGGNEAIECFPVGRRLAFDAAKGRLWVVCRSCGQWNLSPLEERWEAVEECERRFRDARLRVSTDNIGLAKLADGTELVRIGRPQRPEFAAWRYGDQFGRRRKQRILYAGLGLSALAAGVVGAHAVGIGLLSGWYTVYQVGNGILRGKPDEVVARIPTDIGKQIPVKRKALSQVYMIPGEGAADWRLRLSGENRSYELSGSTAAGAVRLLLPHLNRYGGAASAVRQAVRLIEQLPDPSSVFRFAVNSRDAQTPVWWEEDKYRIRRFSPVLRLALEMVAHEDIERRALEGEMAALEQAWREAEEIAAISDRLLIPEDIEQRIRDSPPTPPL